MQVKSSQTEMPADEEAATLAISPEKVCFIIMKAREFDAKDEVTEPDPGSNPSDDKHAAVLEDHSDDPVVEELTSLINSLSEDEQIDLVALMWLGRDDYSATDWPTVREEAARAHNERTANYARGANLPAGSIPITLDSALPRKLGAGTWTYHHMAGYTSVGVGSSIVTVRINCFPEITLHRLCHAGSASAQ